MLSLVHGDVLKVALEDFSERYSRYRLRVPEAEQSMIRSLERYGQLSPVVACWQEGELELIDGFKRLVAARCVGTIHSLFTRVLEVDERMAKAAIYLLNRVGRRTSEVEEARIVHALVREDGLSQQEVAEVLGRHKSWVCRRVALVEKLCGEARRDLTLGYLTPTAARALIRLPEGNQPDLVEVARRESLTSAELQGVVDRLLACRTPAARDAVLAAPREALGQDEGEATPACDPRLSGEGNRLKKRLELLLDLLRRMESWLTHRAVAELTPRDTRLLVPELRALSHHAQGVAEATEDFLVNAEA